MMMRITKKGFTLVELIMVIAIGAIILVPTALVVVESLRSTFLPEYYTIASSLLEDRVEWVTNLRFAEVVNSGPTSFSGNFSGYSYQVTVNYVQPADLNTPVDPTATDYKRVQVAILHSGFPDVTATTLRTNN